jgi:hypothetical protein
MCIIFTRIGCTLLTCDMYMSDLRHIHDPVLSSFKMEGISLLFFLRLTAFKFTAHIIHFRVVFAFLNNA